MDENTFFFTGTIPYGKESHESVNSLARSVNPEHLESDVE
jgi:hypothetical protein